MHIKAAKPISERELRMKLKELDSNDLELLADGLLRLREVKVEAHSTVVKAPGHECFTLADFGVPKIDNFLAKIESALEESDDELVG